MDKKEIERYLLAKGINRLSNSYNSEDRSLVCSWMKQNLYDSVSLTPYLSDKSMLNFIKANKKFVISSLYNSVDKYHE